MRIKKALFGAKLKPYSTQISHRDIFGMALAVQDFRECYYNDLLPAGELMAPPTLPIAITWPILSQIERYLNTDIDPEILLRKIHLREHLKNTSPIHPDEKLEITGEISELSAHPKGTVLGITLKAINTRGELKFTEITSALLRDVQLEGESKVLNSSAPSSSPKSFRTPIWSKKISLSTDASYLYDIGSGIHFPIHTSAQFAQKVGLPGPLLQGSALLGFAARDLMTSYLKKPGPVQEIQCTFKNMVFLPAHLTLHVLGDEDGIEFNILNEGGKPVLEEGWMKI